MSTPRRIVSCRNRVRNACDGRPSGRAWNRAGSKACPRSGRTRSGRGGGSPPRPAPSGGFLACRGARSRPHADTPAWSRSAAIVCVSAPCVVEEEEDTRPVVVIEPAQAHELAPAGEGEHGEAVRKRLAESGEVGNDAIDFLRPAVVPAEPRGHLVESGALHWRGTTAAELAGSPPWAPPYGQARG